MELYLKHKNLWLSTEGYPTDDETIEDTRKKRDVKAMLKMGFMMKPCCYPHIRNASTAAGAWKNLEMAFEDEGLNRRLYFVLYVQLDLRTLTQ
jgi:hypothetical protein